ncbi:MAG: class I SAM-dependent methyltransferase [Rhodothermales bacterium]
MNEPLSFDKDYFSTQSVSYARYRPRYPAALFGFIAAQCPVREQAWDVATGNGQAAHALARHFAHVVATDASRQQIARAVPRNQVTYRVEPAEATSLARQSVDVVTVAQALHWLDVDRFYAEVRRVLKPGGMLAAWTYGLFRVTPYVDRVLDRYYHDLVGSYWPPERRHVEAAYRTLPFPFERLAAPAFEMDVLWSLTDVQGYLGTWSATQRYKEAKERDPVEGIRVELKAAWGEVDVRPVRWPLHVCMGRPSR